MIQLLKVILIDFSLRANIQLFYSAYIFALVLSDCFHF